MITRFAPSPTGPLHLGHAYSALLAHDAARAAGGRFVLRIEDIDHTRARPEWEAQIYADLTWLGVSWDAPPMRQSDRLPAYSTALQSLWAKGYLYPCHCNRRDIQAAVSAPQEGALALGPDGVVYPGTCAPKGATSMPPNADMPPDTALRLNLRRALASTTKAPNGAITFIEKGQHVVTTATEFHQNIGDIVLSRRDYLGAYHLCAVLDDAAQNITHIIRGEDLFEATKIHALLQRLLHLPTPTYHHHRLIRDDAGKRLAKRDDARAIAKYRAEGASPEIGRAHV